MRLTDLAVQLADNGWTATAFPTYQAFWEHQPIRSQPSGPNLALYRSVQWGSLIDFIVTDGRQYRDDQPCLIDYGLSHIHI